MKTAGFLIGLTVAIIIVGAVLVPICMETPDNPNTLDVIVIDGQSNAAYYATNNGRIDVNEIDLNAPSHNLYYYGTSSYSNYWNIPGEKGIYEMYRDGWIIGGNEAYLAYGLSEKSGRDILVINVARGAQSINWLSPGGAGWTYAKSCIFDAMSMIPDTYDHINYLGWVMIQGEADKDMPIDEYKSKFMSLSNGFKQLGFVQCYISNTRPYWGGNATVAQHELADTVSTIHIATSISDTFTEENGLLVSGDPIHYSQLGRNLVAGAIADYIPNEPYSSAPNHLIMLVPLMVIVALVGAVAYSVTKKNA